MEKATPYSTLNHIKLNVLASSGKMEAHKEGRNWLSSTITLKRYLEGRERKEVKCNKQDLTLRAFSIMITHPKENSERLKKKIQVATGAVVETENNPIYSISSRIMHWLKK